LPELFQLQKDVAAAVQQRQITERHDTLVAMKKLAEERGFDLNELLGVAAGKGKEAKVKATGIAKYRNPADSTATWTGRGRKPQWVVDFLANGGTLDQIAI